MADVTPWQRKKLLEAMAMDAVGGTAPTHEGMLTRGEADLIERGLLKRVSATCLRITDAGRKAVDGE